MRTESKKTFRTGFMLTEPEFRRIVSDIADQLAQDDSALAEPQFELKFRNGSIAYPRTIDEILQEENHGSALITRLKLRAQTISKDDNDEPSRSVTMEFVNGLEEEEDFGIKYTINGDHRDWVFITSSRLTERIPKIRRIPVEINWQTGFILFFLLFLLTLLFSMITRLPTMTRFQEERFAMIEEIDRLRRSGEITDPVDAVSRGFKVYSAPPDVTTTTTLLDLFYPWPIAIASVLVLIVLAAMDVNRFFPPYNFYRGDYINFYDRRSSQGRIVYGAIGLAFVVGVAASYLANVLAPN